MSTDRLGSRDNPYTGKAFKEKLIPCLQALVNKDDCFKDVDGQHRIFGRLANGRSFMVELRAEDQPFDDAVTPLHVHEIDYKQLRPNWTTVSAGLVFGIAFAFHYENSNKNPVRLVIYKCEEHPADEFVSDIVADLQAGFEFDAIYDMGEQMQAGFKRLEKLIQRQGKFQ